MNMTARNTFPLLTLLLVSVAGFLFFAGQGDAGFLALLYSRAGLADGELWRLFTGHLMHFSWPHLAADIGAFLLLGVVIEREQGRGTLSVLLVLLALGTSSALWVLVPELAFYGGISALNYGLLTWLCLTQRDVVQKRWQWVLSMLPALLVVHIAWQYTTETTLISSGLPRSVRVAWQAHLFALLLAFGCAGIKDIVRTWLRPALARAAAR